jgi:hypothetical protein
MTEEPKQADRDAQGTELKDYITAAINAALSRLWDKRLGDKAKKFLGNHPTLVLTLLYLYVTAIGIIYSAILYGRFGINIFDYAETADFLLAAFKNPIAFLAPVILVAMGAAGLAVTEVWSRLFIQQLRSKRLSEHAEAVLKEEAKKRNIE